MDIPKDKNYPKNAVQCDSCGGNGCLTCEDSGWLTPKFHPQGRTCRHGKCGKPLPPSQGAVYCSNECAAADA